MDTAEQTHQALNVLCSHNKQAVMQTTFFRLSSKPDFMLAAYILLYTWNTIVKTWDTFEDNNETTQFFWLTICL